MPDQAGAPQAVKLSSWPAYFNRPADRKAFSIVAWMPLAACGFGVCTFGAAASGGLWRLEKDGVMPQDAAMISLEDIPVSSMNGAAVP